MRAMTRPNMLLLALVLLPVLNACSPGRGNGVYKLTQQEALGRLQGADLSGFNQARRCDTDLSFAVAAEPPQGLRWSVLAGGREVAQFAVQLEPLPDGTLRTAIDASPDQAVGTGLRGPLRPAAEEFVDAVLTGRSFDPGQLGPAPAADACAAPVTTTPGSPGNANASGFDGRSDAPAGEFGAPTRPQGGFDKPSAGATGGFGQPASNPNPGGNAPDPGQLLN
jgi:hypothetical protein